MHRCNKNAVVAVGPDGSVEKKCSICGRVLFKRPSRLEKRKDDPEGDFEFLKNRWERSANPLVRAFGGLVTLALGASLVTIAIVLSLLFSGGCLPGIDC